MLLGYVTAMSDRNHGGALIHKLSKPLALSGASLTVAGRSGIPRASATVPATGIITSISSGDPAVVDPLAGGRQVTSGNTDAQSATTLLHLNRSGVVHLSSRAKLSTIAYLSGDLVRKAGAVDLSLPGSPKLAKAPAKGVLTFSGKHNFKAGDVLMFGATKFTPSGLIAVAKAAHTGPNTTAVTYRIGGLLDAFRKLDLTSQVPLAPRPKANHVKANDVTPIDGTHTLNFSGSHDFTLSSSPHITGNVGYSFQPALTLRIVIHQGLAGIPDGFSMHYAVDTNTSLTASLTFGTAWSGSHTFDLGSRELGAFELGPISVVPTLKLGLTVNASANANVQFTETINQHSHVGFTLNNASVSGDSGNTFGAPSRSGTTSVNVSASASVALDFEFALAIEGVAGPDASAEASAGITFTPSGWHIHAGGSFGIGIDLNVLDNSVVKHILSMINIPTNPTWTIHDLSWDWSGKYGTTGGSGGGSTGGGGGGTPPTSTSVGQGQGRINISPCLNLRSGPGPSSAQVGCVPSGLLITIDCTTQGSSVTGPYGATTLWDHTSYDGQTGYVTDAYVFTGTDGAVAGTCGAGGGGTTSPPVSGGNGRINISPCLNFHSAPSGSSTQLDCIPNNLSITIDCTAQGNSVTGPYGATTLWDHTSYNGHAGYVSDAYVYTGTANPVAGTCGSSAPPSQPTGYHAGRQVSIDQHASGGVSGHTGPSNSYAAGPTRPANSALWIVCYVSGQSITGPYNTTSMWDLGDDGYYYTDAWLYTGTNSAVVPACSPRSVTVDSHASGGVSGHRGPDNAYAAGPTRAVNSGLRIFCYVDGESITGPYNTTTIWDYSDDGYYYADAWIYTGTNGAAVPHC